MTVRGLATGCAVACLLLLLFLQGARAQTALGAPESVTSAGGATSLSVLWSAPASDGRSAITAYDLRYILSGASDAADEHRTMSEDAWTTGALQYELTGLRRDTSYDVQVRALIHLNLVAIRAPRAHVGLRQQRLDAMAR
jgi:hypothetical protein